MKLNDLSKEIKTLAILGSTAFKELNDEHYEECIIHHYIPGKELDCDSDVIWYDNGDYNFQGRFENWDDEIEDDAILFVDEFDGDNEWTKVHCVATYNIATKEFKVEVDPNYKRKQ